MRELNVGTKKYTKVVAVDERGLGNANHNYEVLPSDKNGVVLGKVVFQNGPIKEKGVNGVTNEDLIVIVIDRLEGFQSGKYASTDNSNAMRHLLNALSALRKRTNDREARGVEGTSAA